MLEEHNVSFFLINMQPFLYPLILLGFFSLCLSESIVSPTLERLVRKQERIHSMNTPRMLLHILDRIRDQGTKMDKPTLVIHENKLKAQVRKYYDETRRLLKGFMIGPIKPGSSVAVVKLVLFHLEHNPPYMSFYATRREMRLLKKYISSYHRASEWDGRKDALDSVLRVYEEVRLLMDMIEKMEKMDYTSPLSREEKEVVKIGLERIGKIVTDEEIKEYIDDYILTGNKERLPVIIDKWISYKRLSLS